MREIAVELYMQDHRHLDIFNTPEETELREGGYLDRARPLALRNIQREASKFKTIKEMREDD